MLTLPRFECLRAQSVADAVQQLAADPGGTLVIAGGTDAVPNLKHRLHEHPRLLLIGGVSELRFVRDGAAGLELGPLTTLSEIATHERLRRDYPILAQASGLVASPQIRNMGTLGGNLCLDTRCTYYNQTYFWREALGFCLKKSGTVCHVVPQGKRCVAAHSSDVAPALIALGASIEIAGGGGRRTVALDDFFVGDGVHNNLLLPGELITRVTVPAESSGMAGSYQKLRPRGAIDFPMLSVAFAARMSGGRCEHARLVIGALGAKPRVIGGVAELAAGRPLDDVLGETLAAAAAKQCHPLINVAYDRDYRQAMVPVFVRRAVRAAANGSGR